MPKDQSFVTDVAPGSTGDSVLELRLKRIFEYLSSISPYVGSALHGSEDVGILASDKISSFGSAKATYIKLNNYTDGRNDRFSVAGQAAQLYINNDAVLRFRKSINTPVEDGIIQWGPGYSVIPESGSNSNGYWVRFPDGTQICTYKGTQGSSAGTWTFPQPFVSEPAVTANIYNGANVPNILFAVHFQTITATSAYFVKRYYTPPDTAYGDAITELVSFIAVGRWY